jgi:hypothetical protein
MVRSVAQLAELSSQEDLNTLSHALERPGSKRSGFGVLAQARLFKTTTPLAAAS